VKASAVSSTEIQVTWNASTPGSYPVAGYYLYRNNARVGSTTATSFLDTGLTPSTTYAYTVAAYDTHGNVSSQSSPPAYATTLQGPQGAPNAPTNLTATSTSPSQINLAWTTSTDPYGTIAGYNVYRCTGSNCTPNQRIGSVSASTTSYQDTGLSASTAYTYDATAFDAWGDESSPSNEATATTKGGGQNQPPGQPQNLNANPVSSSEIDLSWSASVPGSYPIAGYYIYRNGSLWDQTANTNYKDTALAPSRQYAYQVQAFDTQNNTSTLSSQAQGTTQTAPPVTMAFGFHTVQWASWPQNNQNPKGNPGGIQVPFDNTRLMVFTGAFAPGVSGFNWSDIQIATTGYPNEPTSDFTFVGVDDAMEAIAAQEQLSGKLIGAQYTVNAVSSLAGLPNDEGYKFDGTPTTCNCQFNPGRKGATCSPPADLNPDGTGSDAYYKDFLAALATHVHQMHEQNPTGYADITIWDGGNEWYDHEQFCASYQMEARMLQDTKCIIRGQGPGCTSPGINPSATVMTAALTDGAGLDQYQEDGIEHSWDRDYLATVPASSTYDPYPASPAQLADAINFHCYAYGGQEPEDYMLSLVQYDKERVNENPDSAGKPMFCSEGGWQSKRNFAPSWGAIANWLPRYLISLASTQVENFTLFGLDFWNKYMPTSSQPNNFSTLWSAQSIPPDACTITPPPLGGGGYACTTAYPWTQVYNWIDGAVMTSPAASTTVIGDNTIWEAPFTRSSPSGYQGMAVWETCSTDETSGCATSTVSVASQYTDYQTIDGTTYQISGNQVPVNIAPLVAENETIGGEMIQQYQNQNVMNGTASATIPIAIGSRVKVTTKILNVRKKPSTSSKVLGTAEKGATGIVIGGPTSGGGHVWMQVQYDSGLQGWSVAEHLKVIAAKQPLSSTTSTSTPRIPTPPPVTAPASSPASSAVTTTSLLPLPPNAPLGLTVTPA
jgi:chitodextrinase